MSVKCDVCNDTGFVEVQSVTLSRQYFSKEKNCLVVDEIATGEWVKEVCYYAAHFED